MSFICMRRNNHFHIKGWALNLFLIQRPSFHLKIPWWKISLPMLYTSTLGIPPFFNLPKKAPFSAEPPRTGHYKEHHTGSLRGRLWKEKRRGKFRGEGRRGTLSLPFFLTRPLRILRARNPLFPSLPSRLLEEMGARKNGVREGDMRVSLARTVLSCARYFQAPTPQATSSLIPLTPAT